MTKLNNEALNLFWWFYELLRWSTIPAKAYQIIKAQTIKPIHAYLVDLHSPSLISNTKTSSSSLILINFHHSASDCQVYSFFYIIENWFSFGLPSAERVVDRNGRTKVIEIWKFLAVKTRLKDSRLRFWPFLRLRTSWNRFTTSRRVHDISQLNICFFIIFRSEGVGELNERGRQSGKPSN